MSPTIPEDTWRNAIKAVQEEGLSYRIAGAKYGVNPTSLYRRSTKKVQISAKPGSPTFLTSEQEKGILDMITYKSSHGMCMSHAEIRLLARDIALRGSKHEEIPPNFPSDKWVQRFIKRHPLISSRKSQILDCKRAEYSTQENVEHYYKNLSKEIVKYSPDRIFNCDETGVTTQGPCSIRVVCPKKSPANIRRSNNKENVTIMACVNAAGDALPPMYIFMGKRRQLEWMNGCLPGSTCAMTDSSMINGVVFLNWLRWFKKQMTTDSEVLLILDGHFSHIPYPVLLEARDMHVNIFTLPSHTTHFLQPLDVVNFQVFKRLYEKVLHKFPLEHEGCLPTKGDVVALTVGPWRDAFTRENIQSAFKKTGIHPLNKEVMLRKVIGDGAPVRTDAMNLLITDQAFSLTSRQTRLLKRRGVHPERIEVCTIGLMAMLRVVEKKKEKQRTFVDGGVLMTSDEMTSAVKERDKATYEKKRLSEEKRQEKLELKLMGQEDKKGRNKKRKTPTKEARDRKKTQQSAVV
jgi:hypothetical protein